MAAHLAGAFAGNSTLPVIGIPMKGGAMDGLDALLATVQMPSGIPVATVAINGAKNAAVLAAQILAVSDDGLAAKLTRPGEDGPADRREGGQAPGGALIQIGDRSDENRSCGARCARSSNRPLRRTPSLTIVNCQFSH